MLKMPPSQYIDLKIVLYAVTYTPPNPRQPIFNALVNFLVNFLSHVVSSHCSYFRLFLQTLADLRKKCRN